MEPLTVRGYEELPLDELDDYPKLKACHEAWLEGKQGAVAPDTLGFDEVPRAVWPYLMLLDYLPYSEDVTVRLAGTYVGERSSSQDEGRGLRSYFSEEDAATVFESLKHVAETCQPSLARRSYVSIEGREYHYVRIILPLSADGKGVTGFFKTIEPDTLTVI